MRRVEKPWGYEDIWAETDKYVGKILFIKAGHKLSKQYHNVKDETIMVLEGSLKFWLDTRGEAGNSFAGNLFPERDQPIHIKPGYIHRMEAITDCRIVEVSTPELDDVVRLEDSYGRET